MKRLLSTLDTRPAIADISKTGARASSKLVRGTRYEPLAELPVSWAMSVRSQPQEHGVADAGQRLPPFRTALAAQGFSILRSQT